MAGCVVKGERIRVELSGFGMDIAPRVALAEGAPEVIRWGRAIARKDGSVSVNGRTPSGDWRLDVAPAVNTRGVKGLRFEMTGRLKAGAAVAGLVPFHVDDLAADHLLVLGRSAGGSRAILPGQDDGAFQSWQQCLLTKGGLTLQLAQPMLQDNPSKVTGRTAGGRVRELAVTTPVPAGAGRTARAEPLFLFSDSGGHGLMEAWAEAHQPKRAKVPVPGAGWNSWDYFRWTVTEEDILRNAEFIAKDPVLRKHVKRIIVDDGWQYCYGEWDANPLFPHGMEWLAQRIRKLGFEAGLWICPGVAEPHARIAQWDPDMLAKGLSGKPCLGFSCMERKGFLLDPTVPKTQKWLKALFTRYADMGFTYFKLDFLQQTLHAPVFADPSVPRGRLVRRLLQPAVEALKGRARIMGCGYDFFAGTDAVDEVRTSSDIHARWDSIQGNAGSIAARWWAQGRLWGNDPDFALCRGPETSRDRDLQRLKACLVYVKPEMKEAPIGDYVLATMSAPEARTLLSLVLISGGAVNLSDDLPRLDRAGLDLARRTVAAERGEAGVPLDLFKERLPAIWTQRLQRGQRVLLVNWADRARTVTGEAGVAEGLVWRDFWTGMPVKPVNGRFSARVEPHGCLLIEGRTGARS